MHTEYDKSALAEYEQKAALAQQKEKLDQLEKKVAQRAFVESADPQVMEEDSLTQSIASDLEKIDQKLDTILEELRSNDEVNDS